MPEEPVIVERKIIIKNKAGLHARPAALFVQIANKYDSVITVIKGKEKVNGKSIMGILMLAAGRGSQISIMAEGHDAEEAVQELSLLLLEEKDADYGFGGKKI
ncbi:MAG: HPr family phosphocarrier protein [Candidatus Omnitrophica bacterium]|nr:HPr family phosphocarrier protein [Candidatus Omnitrophota bacterium]